MHLKNKLSIAMMVCALVGAQPAMLLAQSTTYYFGPSGGGYYETAFCDEAGYGVGAGIGLGTQLDAPIGVMSGSLTYTPSATRPDLYTLEMQGNAAQGTFSSSLSWDDSHYNANGIFTPATVSVNFTVGSANGVSFDTGPTIVPPNSGMELEIPVTGTYAFTTGGQTYNGTFNYNLPMIAYNQVQGVNSTTLTFSTDAEPPVLNNFRSPLADITAANGLEMALYAQDPDDGVSYYGWHDDNVIATTPEPGTLTLLSIGAVGLMMSLRRRAK